MESADEMLAMLMETAKGFEGYSLHRFKLYRERRTGDTQGVEVEVAVSDGGNQRTRYSVSFTTDDGRRVAGNSKGTLREACYILSMSPMLD